MPKILFIAALLVFNLSGLTQAGSSVAPGAGSVGSNTGIKKKWTVMAYVNGNNDLAEAAKRSIQLMKRASSSADINIVAELGSVLSPGRLAPAQRLAITKPSDLAVFNSNYAAHGKPEDMGDYTSVISFVKWAKKNYPSEKYILVLWGHGTGWADPVLSRKGLLPDFNVPSYIKTSQIKEIFLESGVGKVDVLVLDACSMQSAELAFELGPFTDVIVGSEDLVPAAGLPYDAVLGWLASAPGASAEEVGTAFVYAYTELNSRNALTIGGQISAVRSSQMQKLAELLSQFVALTIEVDDKPAIKTALAGVPRYAMKSVGVLKHVQESFYGDLARFCSIVGKEISKEHPKAEELKKSANELNQFITDNVIISNRAWGDAGSLSLSGGISVYLPPASVHVDQSMFERNFSNSYSDMPFSKITGWDKLVAYLYKL